MLRDKKKQMIIGEIQALFYWDLQIKETNNVMPSQAQSIFSVKNPLWALKKSSVADLISVEQPAVKICKTIKLYFG